METYKAEESSSLSDHHVDTSHELDSLTSAAYRAHIAQKCQSTDRRQEQCVAEQVRAPDIHTYTVGNRPSAQPNNRVTLFEQVLKGSIIFLLRDRGFLVLKAINPHQLGLRRPGNPVLYHTSLPNIDR